MTRATLAWRVTVGGGLVVTFCLAVAALTLSLSRL